MLEGARELGGGRVVLALQQQHIADVDLRLDQLGIERERALKMRQRLVVPALGRERIGEIVVRRRPGRA